MTVFGTLPDGGAVHRISLMNGPLSAEILTMGAIVQDLRLQGIPRPLVLGAPDLSAYLGPARYFGAIVGRFANRIGGAGFMLDGREYRTDPNFNDRHTLHGGSDGLDLQLWRIHTQSAAAVTLTSALPDGHMGFPGRLTATVRIALEADALCLQMQAESDAPTPCSLAHHGYFNLSGADDIRGHHLQIAADRYLPVDAGLIPKAIAPVAGTPFDFRQPRPIGDAGYDHNFCLSHGRDALRPVARLSAGALSMQVETDAPGLQIYDGAHIHGLAGLDGRIYGAHAGLAMETQAWPDAPNRPDFPSAILRPGEIWRQTTRYRFIRD